MEMIENLYFPFSIHFEIINVAHFLAFCLCCKITLTWTNKVFVIYKVCSPLSKELWHKVATPSMVAFQNFLTQLARNVFPRVPTATWAPPPPPPPHWIHNDALLLSLLHTPSHALIGSHLTLSRLQLSSKFILRMHCIADSLWNLFSLCFLQHCIMYIVKCIDKCLNCI